LLVRAKLGDWGKRKRAIAADDHVIWLRKANIQSADQLMKFYVIPPQAIHLV
jgi:hypothetical protein